MIKYNALVLLLAMPDPPELIGRGYRYTYPRIPNKNPDEMKRDLAQAYVQHRVQTYADVSSVVSVRRSSKRLKVVRRAR